MTRMGNKARHDCECGDECDCGGNRDACDFCTDCKESIRMDEQEAVLSIEAESYRVDPAEHICVECLEDDCDCGGSELACNGCSECEEIENSRL